MIRINCTNCKAQLSIDEAFAGGVCRCQFCGRHLLEARVGGVIAARRLVERNRRLCETELEGAVAMIANSHARQRI